jgi:GNAT superfamily N-acetyltransferase
MSDLRLDHLTPADLDAALALSIEAGWNQVAADWRRLLDLAPHGCLAGRVRGGLVATATVVSYAPGVSWIGMVLVARAQRQRGIGTAMLQAALAAADGVGAVVGLDATDLGRPLYLTHGFADVAPIDRWVGTLRPPGRPLSSIALTALAADLARACAFDRAACGADRGALLAHLAREPEAASWVATQGGRVVGLACLRPGREHAHLGPVVGEAAALGPLLAAAAERLGGGSVLLDAPRGEATTALLGAHGLRVQRRLTRMTRPARQGILMGAAVAAATAFEWG